MKKVIALFVLVLAGTSWAGAKVTLPSFFSDNMVLQQNCDAAIWGWTDSGKKVTITTTWSKEKVSVKPDADGKWSARIRTAGAGGPYSITVSDGEKTTIGNVLLGEVWFCSGQSNMEMPVRGFNAQPVKGSAEFIMGADPDTPIRMCTIDRKPSLKPLEECTGSWKENTPEAVAATSAAAYFFAVRLQKVLGIPVGILISEWGGSTIQTWIPREVLSSKFPGEFDLAFLDGDQMPQMHMHTPCTLFNGQVAPLVPFTFKGMLWYQGESNRGGAEQYIRLQKEYVAAMRELFQNPDAPFYFVQIAPYNYSDPDGWTSGYFCEAQEKSLDVIPHSGMVTTLDIGEYATIHPSRKQEIGYRLAALALVNDYGLKGFNPVAPRLESVRFENGEAILTFNTGDQMGLSPGFVELKGFEVAGADKVFHPAVGIITGWNNQVVVKCPEVAEPAAVRYCFRNWCEGTLFNNYGIPAGPFRTDDWNL